jgi:hypothetical protein
MTRAHLHLGLPVLLAAACYHGLDPTDLDDATTTSTSLDPSSSGESALDHPDALEFFDPCAACGCLAWATHLPGPSGDQLVTALTAMPDGGALLGAATDADLTLTRLTPAGEPAWTHTLPGQFTDLHLAPAGDGLFLLAATFSGALQLGEGPPLSSAGGTDGLVLLVSESEPARPIWRHGFGDAADQRITGMVPAGACSEPDLSDCRVAVAGLGTGALGLAGLDLGKRPRVFTAELSADLGSPQRAFAPPDGEPLGLPSLAPTPDGGHLLLAALRHDDDLGDLTLLRWRPKEGAWSTVRFRAPGEQRAGALATAPDGAAHFLARTLAALDLGTGTLGRAGADTPFLASLTSAGEVARTLPLATWPGGQQALALLPDATALVLGDLFTDAEFGAGTLDHQGGGDAFLVQFTPDGAPRCGRTYGDVDRQQGLALATADHRALALMRTRGAINPRPGVWDTNLSAEDLVVVALDRSTRVVE